MADTAAGKSNIFAGFFPHIDSAPKEDGGSPLLNRRDKGQQQQQQHHAPDENRLPAMEVQVFDDWKQEDEAEAVDVPEPDYGEEGGHSPEHMGDRSPDLMRIYTTPADDSELAQPKKLVNPCMESKERQMLHRELMMNQKRGVDVLSKKSELKKEMERRQDAHKKKETEDVQRSKRSSFEIKLEEQAKKLDFDSTQREKAIKEEQALPEFVKVHHRINKHQVTS